MPNLVFAEKEKKTFLIHTYRLTTTKLSVFIHCEIVNTVNLIVNVLFDATACYSFPNTEYCNDNNNDNNKIT